MLYTSVSFLIFFSCVLILYYIVPKKFQWLILLAASIFFYCFSNYKMLFYFSVTIISTWLIAIYIEKNREKKRSVKLVFIFGILINIMILLVMKNKGIFESMDVLNSILIVPLGISFYTFQTVGYLTDVYRGDAKAETNVMKYALFSSYFPQILSGPIGRYNELSQQFYQQKKFDYHLFCFGAQRMLWGFFKKMVVADRAAIFVNEVFDNYYMYRGVYIVIGVILFGIQLYADFSGCMDIVIGASEMLQIKLRENFQEPFFSRSISEFWRRWHISLGEWFKDYLFYPILKSSLMQNLQKKLKKIMKKKTAKNFTTYLGMLILWTVIGLWHGCEGHYLIGAGLILWFFIVGGKIMQPVFAWIQGVLRINTDTFSYRLFEMFRTICLMLIAWIFWRAESIKAALYMFKRLFYNNIVDLFNKSIYNVGLDAFEFKILMIGIILMLIVSILKQYGSVRTMLAKQNMFFRYLIYYTLLAAILIYGIYGTAYDAQTFIYFRL